MSPTAVVLVRLAGAFDLTLAGLLLRAEGERGRLTRNAEQPRWRDPQTGHLRRQVFARPDHPLEVAAIDLPAGQRVTLPASSYTHIRQLVWVQDGTLVIVEGGAQHQLATGDCLAFGAPAEVTLANESGSPCTYLVVIARNATA